MNIAIIGRTEILYNTAVMLKEQGHNITCIVTAKETPEYTKTLNDFHDLSVDWSIPFVSGANINDHKELLEQTKSDISVSINYSGIIPQDVIDLFPLGVLNVHGGDLPKYRGNACQAWAILNGESRIGLCVHRMIGGELDSGDIIARDFYDVIRTTKVTEVWAWMTCVTPDLVAEAIDKLEVDPHYFLEKQSKDILEALRCYPRLPEDGLIDWNSPAVNILRLINASNRPYSGAFTFLKGRKLIIWDADLVDEHEVFLAVPGQVVKVKENDIEVACYKSKLLIKSIEIDGRVCKPSEMIKSIRIRLG